MNDSARERRKTVIVFPLYPLVTHLDFTGPHQVLTRLPGAEVIVASVGGASIEADGLTFANLPPLSSIGTCDVICVPGGYGCMAAMQDEAFMGEVRRAEAEQAAAALDARRES